MSINMMKVDALRMCTDTCEGKVVMSKEFNELDPLMQLDILSDWQFWLERLYRAAHRKHKAQMAKLQKEAS